MQTHLKSSSPTQNASITSVIIALGFITMSIASAQSSQSARPPQASRPVKGAVVTGVVLRPIKTLKGEKCPEDFAVIGDMATDGAASVKYTWISSDGGAWPESTLVFTGATAQSVSSKWILGGPGTNTDHWLQLSVVSPNKKLSKRIRVDLACAK
jgi:hypothetical protein